MHSYFTYLFYPYNENIDDDQFAKQKEPNSLYIQLSVIGMISTLLIGFLITLIDFDYNIVLKDHSIRRDSIYFHLFLCLDNVLLTSISCTKLSESICLIHAMCAVIKLVYYLYSLPYYDNNIQLLSIVYQNIYFVFSFLFYFGLVTHCQGYINIIMLLFIFIPFAV